MRRIAFAPAFLILSSFAFAVAAPQIDLDRPGVLHQLQRQNPERYQAVQAVLRAAEHSPCRGNEAELLKTRLNVSDLECGALILTRYPATFHLNFKLDGSRYAATVRLKGDEKLLPALSEIKPLK